MVSSFHNQHLRLLTMSQIGSSKKPKQKQQKNRVMCQFWVKLLTPFAFEYIAALSF